MLLSGRGEDDNRRLTAKCVKKREGRKVHLSVFIDRARERDGTRSDGAQHITVEYTGLDGTGINGTHAAELFTAKVTPFGHSAKHQ